MKNAAAMSLNCGASFVKYLLCFFNFLLFAVGGALLTISIWIAVDNTSFFLLTRITDNANLQDYNEASVLEEGAYVLIAAGALLFLLGFLGCCGAAMESRPLLATYAVLVIIVFLLELTAGILAAIYKQEVEEHMQEFLQKTLRTHYSSKDKPNSITVAWDAMMINMQCCGVNNYTDFEFASRWQNRSELQEHVLPRACCRLEKGPEILQEGQVLQQGSGSSAYKLVDETCLYDPNDENSHYMVGCHGRLRAWVEGNADCLLGVILGVGVLELVVVGLALCLCAFVGGPAK